MKIMQYRSDELLLLLRQMSGIYDSVRLVDPDERRRWIVDAGGWSESDDVCHLILDVQ